MEEGIILKFKTPILAEVKGPKDWVIWADGSKMQRLQEAPLGACKGYSGLGPTGPGEL